MPLTAGQRRNLVRIERSRDAAAITAAINQVLAGNPTADLLDIEMAFRAYRNRRASKIGLPSSTGSAGRRNRTAMRWAGEPNGTD